jgi:anti-sigma factor RsiW
MSEPRQPSQPPAPHVGAERLQLFADGEIDARDGAMVRRHVAACAECTARLDAIVLAGETYLAYHRGTLKAQDPAPPRPWEDLRPRLSTVEPAISGHAISGHAVSRHAISRTRVGNWRAWLAVAAAILVAVAVYSRMNRPVPVSAAELLRHAAAAADAVWCGPLCSPPAGPRQPNRTWRPCSWPRTSVGGSR